MMYTPRHFLLEDHAAALDVMRAHPFATMISVADGAPVTTHLPLQFEQREGSLVLVGHMARANPHWQAWATNARVWVIFHGPDAYVSPASYTTPEAVPTWNYIVVHAQGAARAQHESADKESILKRLIDEHDPMYRAQWDALSEKYRENMKRGIVGFEITVEHLEAKFKLSQNRSVADQTGVLNAMRSGGHTEMAEWMLRLGFGAT